MVLESVIEPIVLGREPDENPGGSAVTRDHDLSVFGKAQESGEIVLDLRVVGSEPVLRAT